MRFFFIFLCAFLVCSFIHFEHWKRNVLDGDSWGYYSYLPAAFIYQDLGTYVNTVEATQHYNQSFIDPLKDQYGLYHEHPVTKKNIVKYSSGVAMMLAPFFFISHIASEVLDMPSDGFSLPYRIGAGLGVIFWVALGLYFLFKVLNKYFEQKISTLTIIAIGLGTNLYHNATFNSVMSHGLLFSLYSFLIYFSDKYWQKPTLKSALLVGLSAAMIILIRSNELYCLLIPLFWGLTDRKSFRERFSNIRKHYIHIIAAATVGLAVFLPQLFYWKTLSGNWFFYGYVGEKFNFPNSKFIKGLFGFNNGWLPWSPIMLLSLIGIPFLKKTVPSAWGSILIILPLHIYIVFAWWCWNYINGFGSRPMEHMYPLLAFSMAALFALFWKNQTWRIIMSALVFIAVALNIFHNIQVKKGFLETTNANFAYYYELLGETKPNAQIMIARSSGEIQPQDPSFMQLLYENNFEDTTAFKNGNSKIKFEGQYSMLFEEQGGELKVLFPEDIRGGNLIKISALCYFKGDAPQHSNVWDTPYLYIQWRDNKDKNLYDRDCGVYPFQFINNPDFNFRFTGTPDQWGYVSFYVNIPDSGYSKAILGIWNPQKTPFFLDNLRIELYKRNF